ncbi:hypothetical protein VB741_02200 [Leptothoe sp. PORK10 BA2]|nr:hypothetical protein [Leptothoe sp. PORK10 BA2]
MTLFPAVIVFVLVFLSFSKKVLTTQEEPEQIKKGDPSELNMSDILLRYKLLNELGDKP